MAYSADKTYASDIESKLKQRTRRFALDVISLIQTMPRGLVPDVLVRQLLRSGTSVGANYRSACRARSKADMLSKFAIAEEEADESCYWLDLLVESGELSIQKAEPLMREADELVRMIVSSIKTLRAGAQTQSRVKEELAAYRLEREEARQEVFETLSMAQPT